jgi:hypothetical protein
MNETIDMYAAALWRHMDRNQKTGVRFGLFPAQLMREAEKQGYKVRELTSALMELAKNDGGMRA